MVTREDKSIAVVTPVYVGKTHDFSIFKEENIINFIPPKTTVYVDTGFEGINSLSDDIVIRKPKKKRKNKKLNGGERLGNRLISRERVKVEHAIGGLKKFKIVSAIFRGITQSMDKIMEIACGLWNFHIMKSHENLCGKGL